MYVMYEDPGLEAGPGPRGLLRNQHSLWLVLGKMQVLLWVPCQPGFWGKGSLHLQTQPQGYRGPGDGGLSACIKLPQRGPSFTFREPEGWGS